MGIYDIEAVLNVNKQNKLHNIQAQLTNEGWDVTAPHLGVIVCTENDSDEVRELADYECNGTSDHIQLQNAINEAINNDELLIFSPNSTFNIENQLTIGDGVTQTLLRLYGNNSWLKWNGPSTSDAMLSINYLTNGGRIQDLQVKGNNNAPGIYCNALKNGSELYNLRFWNCNTYCLKCRSSWLSTARDLAFYSNTGECINWTGFNGSRIRNIQVTGCNSNINSKACMYIQGGGGKIENIDFESWGYTNIPTLLLHGTGITTQAIRSEGGSSGWESKNLINLSDCTNCSITDVTCGYENNTIGSSVVELMGECKYNRISGIQSPSKYRNRMDSNATVVIEGNDCIHNVFGSISCRGVNSDSTYFVPALKDRNGIISDIVDVPITS